MMPNLPIVLAIYGDVAIALLRLAVGAIFVGHGYPKLADRETWTQNFEMMGFHPGRFWSMVAGVVEAFGGLALLLGIFVRPVAGIALGQFAVIIIWRMIKKHPWGKFDLDLMIFAALAVLLTLGGGTLSLTNFLRI